MSNKFLYELMHPDSVAIVGASNNPAKMGTLHALSILKDGFEGALYPVHPLEKTVLGLTSFSSARDLPVVPDLAIFVLPSKHLLPIFEDFGKIGTKYAIIITAGFRETGEEGGLQQEKLVETARKYGIRFMGPNCMGVINRANSLNTTVTPLMGPPGHLGLVSQSGTYLAQTMTYLEKRGIHFSKALSVGNEADINLIDVLEYLGEDDETRAISMYIESIRDIPRFLEAASRITPHKPVIAQYVGGSKAGARAGQSHTGAMAGQDPLYNGLFRQAGVIRVHSVEDLYGIGWALANQPRIRGNRIGIITNSGGPGSAIADTLEARGCRVPEFSESLREQIRPLVPPHAPCGNPVDLTFALDMEVMTDKIPEIVMKSGEIDGIVLHGAMSSGFMKALFPHFIDLLPGMSLDEFLQQSQPDLSRATRLPFDHRIPLVVSSFFDREDNHTREYEDNGIPVFDSPEKAARAMGYLVEYMQIASRDRAKAPGIPKADETAGRIIAEALENNQQILDEFSSKRILECYGIPVPEERLVGNEEDAVKAAMEIGFPVVVKGCHPDIAHKTEKGLVQLDIEDERGVRQACERIKNAHGAEIPFLISKMISGTREFLVGLVHDDQFGHCSALGLGGIFTEALNDITYRVAPVGKQEAADMVRDLKTRKIAGSYRGMPSVANDIAEIVARISSLGMVHGEIKEIDINPLLVSGTSPVAVDALIVLKQA